MLKLAQTDRQTNRPTDRLGKNNMSPTTIVGDKGVLVNYQHKKSEKCPPENLSY